MRKITEGRPQEGPRCFECPFGLRGYYARAQNLHLARIRAWLPLESQPNTDRATVARSPKCMHMLAVVRGL
jgi:hypothetical protein